METCSRKKMDAATYTIGFTSVVGDMLHAGHALMLDECKRYCDYLYVGLIVDPTVDRPTKNKPVQSLFERYQQLSSHRAVDEVIPLESEADLELALKALPVNVRFVGVDYKNKDFTGKNVCALLGIEIVYNRRQHGLSSTELRERVLKDELLVREKAAPPIQSVAPSVVPTDYGETLAQRELARRRWSKQGSVLKKEGTEE